MTLQGMIARAYPSPEWAVFFEVANATGFGAKRRADAIALGIWPSRGHHIAGFECKEDRRDWLREKENPAKAEEIASHCDTFWLVTSSDKIARPDEVPAPWGLYVASEDRSRLRAVKTPTVFERDTKVIRRSFAAAMLRKVTETTVPKVELQRLIDDAVKQAVDRSRDGRELKWAKDEAAKLREVIDTFKATTGVDMNHWRGPDKIAAAVDVVLTMQDDRQALERAAASLERAARTIQAALASWPAKAEQQNAEVRS